MGFRFSVKSHGNFLKQQISKSSTKWSDIEWLPVKTGVAQGSILGPLFFVIYINDLSDDLVSTVKLFADGTSLFSVVHESNISANELKNDLQKISEWAYKWKMLFNPDLN